MEKIKDFLLDLLIKLIRANPKYTFYDIKYHLDKLGFKLDKQALLKRIKEII